MNNPVQWFEIATLDLERAKNFYAAVFELDFQYIEMPTSKMYMFGQPGAVGASGALVQADGSEPSSTGTTVYFSSDDVEVPLALVESKGGKIVLPKTDIGEFGFFAQIIDSEGNRIGLHSDQ